MPGWTAAIGGGLRLLQARRAAKLGDTAWWGEHAKRIQREQLRWLVRKASGTEFGKAHSFDRVANVPGDEIVRAFQSGTPIATYDDLFPMMERMRMGAEPDVCWPGVVRDWAQTSGTTAGDKFSPITRDMLMHNKKAAFDVYACAMRFGVSLPSVFSGKIIFLGGSTEVETNDKGVRTGDLSGLVTPLIRWPLTKVVLPSKPTALMSDWPAKINRMAEECFDQDVRWISGMPSWAMVLAERVMQLAKERGRSATCLRDVWPNLNIFVHGGVNFAPFESRVRELWSGDREGDDIPTRLEVYPASEGFIAVQDRVGDPGLRLNIDHRIFYEFVPLEEIHNESPSAFTCEQVEPGQRYVVVMSTCAGLWRYVIGDVVVFDTIPPDGPPRLRIVGRHRLFINAFGENLIVEHIEKAVVEASRTTGARVGEFTASPVYPEQGRKAGLELAIEWDGPVTDDEVRSFGEVFDKSLKAQNVDYTTKRTAGVGMGEPTITKLPMGAFHTWMASRGKLGGQHKCPRCANHRNFMDGVKAIALGERAADPSVVVPDRGGVKS